MKSSCQQQKGQFRLLQEEEEDRDEPGSPSGTAHPGAGVAPTSQLLPCELYYEEKKKKSEGKQCSSSHTKSQPLVCLLTASGWEELAGCWGG